MSEPEEIVGDGSQSRPTVALVGTLDTKGLEYGFLAERLVESGVATLLIDVGILGEPSISPDVSRHEVASSVDLSVSALAEQRDRGAAISEMGRAAAVLVERLFQQRRIHGVLALGGTGGSSLVAPAFQRLPVGVPKLLLSTVASGDTRPYVGAVDVTMMHSVVDIAGINRISAQILTNAAAAVAGMVKAVVPPVSSEKPVIAATMFGVTTPCVTAARERLEALGYEVLVFHATGTGGKSMEALIRAGLVEGVLDITTTELCDDLVGGVFSAGPDRLEAAGMEGIPQVVSLGALDMVNFGPWETVPERFRTRNLYQHNPSVTLMRTTPTENTQLGERVATKLNQATGPTTLFLPLEGVSAIDIPGQPFHDPVATTALIEAIRTTVDRDRVTVVEMETDINDPAFAQAMADVLHDTYEEWKGAEN